MRNLFGMNNLEKRPLINQQKQDYGIVGCNLSKITESSIAECSKLSSRISIENRPNNTTKNSKPVESPTTNSSIITTVHSTKLASQHCKQKKCSHTIEKNVFARFPYEMKAFDYDKPIQNLPILHQQIIGTETYKHNRKRPTDISSTYNDKNQIIFRENRKQHSYGQKRQNYLDKNYFCSHIIQNYDTPSTKGDLNCLDEHFVPIARTRPTGEPDRKFTKTSDVAVQTVKSSSTVDGTVQTEEIDVRSQYSQTTILAANNFVCMDIGQTQTGKKTKPKIKKNDKERNMQVETSRTKAIELSCTEKTIKCTNNCVAPKESEIMAGRIIDAYHIPKKHRLISKSVPTNINNQEISKELKSMSALHNEKVTNSSQFLTKDLNKEMRPRFRTSLPPAIDDECSMNIHACPKRSLVLSNQDDLGLTLLKEIPQNVQSDNSCMSTGEMSSTDTTCSTLSRPVYKKRKLSDINHDAETYRNFWKKISCDGRKKSIESHNKFMNSVSEESTWDEGNDSSVMESTCTYDSTGSWSTRQQDFSSPDSSNDEMSSDASQIRNKRNRQIEKSMLRHISQRNDSRRMYAIESSDFSKHIDQSQMHQKHRKIKELKMMVAVDGLDEDFEMMIYYAEKCPNRKRSIRYIDIELSNSITTCVDLVKSIVVSAFSPLQRIAEPSSQKSVIGINNTRDYETKQLDHCETYNTHDNTEDTTDFKTKCDTEHTTDFRTDNTNEYNTNMANNCKTHSQDSAMDENAESHGTNNTKKAIESVYSNNSETPRPQETLTTPPKSLRVFSPPQISAHSINKSENLTSRDESSSKSLSSTLSGSTSNKQQKSNKPTVQHKTHNPEHSEKDNTNKYSTEKAENHGTNNMKKAIESVYSSNSMKPRPQETLTTPPKSLRVFSPPQISAHYLNKSDNLTSRDESSSNSLFSTLSGSTSKKQQKSNKPTVQHKTHHPEHSGKASTNKFNSVKAENHGTNNTKKAIESVNSNNSVKHRPQETLTSPSKSHVFSPPQISARSLNKSDNLTSSDESSSNSLTSTTLSGCISKKQQKSNKPTVSRPPIKSFHELFTQLENILGEDEH
ncbi:uncharacterized protein LOC106672148 [Cimex lectularius]|uniref:Uncharacterized protein n=1 Tax=Cimex lectularius TaxID=79782 RepID=A0A8I6SG81_CIMLE|nr:uncharacterized protein LOC106672148 [Cimex lectularius]